MIAEELAGLMITVPASPERWKTPFPEGSVLLSVTGNVVALFIHSTYQSLRATNKSGIAAKSGLGSKKGHQHCCQWPQELIVLVLVFFFDELFQLENEFLGRRTLASVEGLGVVVSPVGGCLVGLQ